jgi:FHA domain
MSPANLAQPARGSSSSPSAPNPGLPRNPQALGLRDLGLSVEVLGSQEVGFGSVAWLRIGPTAPGLRALAPLHEGAAGGPRPMSEAESEAASEAARALRIGETGQVPELQLDNQGPHALLIPAHLVLSGGWQTRAVERSVIVPGGGSARVPVKCVEAGRWAPRDEHTARSFEVTACTGVRTRLATMQSMADGLNRNGRFAAEQSAVWQQVDEELTRSAVPSRTRSYEAYLHGVKRRLVAEAQRAAVRPPLAANGVVIFPRGGGFWVEAYPSPDALVEHADDLLSDLFDPVTRGEGPAPAPDLERVLAMLVAAPLHRLDAIPGTIGEAYAIAGGQDGGSRPQPSAAGAVLVVDGALAHLAAGAPPVGREDSTGRSGDRRREPVASSGEGGVRSAVSQPLGAQLPSGDSPAAAHSSDGGNERPRVDLETMRSIYARARDLLPEGPPPRERIQGFRLVRVLDRNISWVDIRIGGDGYAVLGSHDRCDLVLSSDAGVWLRHLAAICVRLEDDSVGLRLIDLRTDLPFFLDDDTARWSVLARGPFAMRLGRHVVCGFPIGPASGESAAVAPAAATPLGMPVAAPLLANRIRDAHETGVLETGISFGGVADARSVAVVPGPNELSNFVASAPVSQIQDLMGASTSPNHVRVTLERGGMGASVELPTEALEAGVLLGRALNCFDGGLRRIFCEAISRAHVLLVRDHDDVFAFDLCSTNGTRATGQRIRRYRLSDAGSTLELGKKVTFRWHRREVAG